METVTLKLNGRIFIPGGYTTQWPNTNGLPKMKGDAFIPFAQIKGGLRRAALRAIVAASGKKLPDIATYYFNAVGGVKGKKTDDDKKRDTSLSAFQDMRMKNPINGLFGSGDVLGSFYAGRMYGAHGLPEGEPVYGVYGGVRSDDSYRDPDGMTSLISDEALDADVAEMHRVNRERTAIKGEIKKLKRGFADKTLDADVRKKLNDAIKEQEKALDALGGGNPVSMPLDGFPYVNAPSFVTSLTLLNVTMVELGLLVTAMEEQMLSGPYLGAHRSSGFGEFSAYWECDQGSITLEPFEKAVIQGDLFLAAREAFLAAVDGFDLINGISGEVSNDDN